jgi:hypothetical protein
LGREEKRRREEEKRRRGEEKMTGALVSATFRLNALPG